MSEKILRTEYSEEMQKSYLDYSMSVITSRAIPDARDGLKPVQRRVLYDMSELHLDHDKPHRKSARIVGDTMGKYHPHGDSSIYETLVVLSQDFKKGMALVDGHGNFGSIEGDGAAAMRQLRGDGKRTGGTPGPRAEPSRKRCRGNRCRHEHQHSAPQFRGSYRRGKGLYR